MASSEVAIMNMALITIGERMITASTEDTKAARVADARYPDVRDEVLSAHPWNCATKRAALSQLATAPAFGFTYEYQLPADYLYLVQLEDPKEEYEIEDNKILSDNSTMKIIYVYQLTEVPKMTPSLVSAIAAKLAFEISNALARDPERSKTLWDAYQAKLSEARFVNATENPDRRFRTHSWTDARMTGTNTPERYRGISAP
jgi:hypothetical protein